MSKNKSIVEYNNFLKAHVTDGDYTHTSFGMPFKKYNIPDDDLDTFYTLYSNLINVTDLFITERPKPVSQLLIDIDWHLKDSDRQYTKDDIKYIVSKTNAILKTYYRLTKKNLKAYVTEKDRPTKIENKDEYKDGFHIMYPNMPMSKAMRYILIDELRDTVEQEDGFGHIKFTNSLESVFDISIVNRNGWMLYGSRKHNGHLYKLTTIYNYDLTEDDLDRHDNLELTNLLSNRKFKDNQECEFDEDTNKVELERKIEAALLKYEDKSKKSKAKKPKQPQEDIIDNPDEPPEDNDNKAPPKESEATKKLKKQRSEINVAKKLAGILSDKRSENYHTWIRTGWALYNISDTLLETFKEFSQKAPNYDENSCEKIWDKAEPDGGLSIASLHLWAKQDNPEAYAKILRESINELFEEAETGTEYDVAKVVYELYKHNYRCASIKNNIWYEFQRHRWVEIESAHTLHTKISEELTKEFAYLNASLYAESATEEGAKRDNLLKRANNISKIILNLKKSGFKGRVIEECSRIFYDGEFEEHLDSNKNLIGFNNGVYDLLHGCFRDGTPDDNITFTVGYDYVEYTNDHPYVKGIIDFFLKTQREADMREYILTLLSSYLDGHTKQQKFIIWTGSGCHAKGTKILMYDGTVKNVEDIKVNEQLMGNDSTPRKVLQLFRGTDDMYKVQLPHNESYIINSAHKLALKFTGSSSIVNNTVNWYEIEAQNQTIVHKTQSFSTTAEAMAFNPPKQLLKDQVIKIKVTTYMKLPQDIKDLLTGFRCPVTFKWSDVNINDASLDDGIPHNLKCNSREVRQAVLDAVTTKHKINGVLQFNADQSTLIDDVIFVARSLGLGAYREDNTVIIDDSPNATLTPISITQIGQDNYYGFEVDKNNSYLAGDFTRHFNSNSKSTAIEFFQMAFGDYCGVLPTTVLTRKRGSSSAATPEMAEMKGKRFVVFQEPESDDKIYVGFMKELTGSDYIYARPLFRDPIRFKPQFKLLLTCNKLPFIPSTDGGTWRRLRVAPWESEFVDVDENGLYNGEPLKENQFPKDYGLTEKLELWKGAFLWYLLHNYYKVFKKADYKIKEPEKVLLFTKKYKKASDIYLEFLEDNLDFTEKKKDYESLDIVYSTFKFWHRECYSHNVCPSKKELTEYLVSHDYEVDHRYLYGAKFRADDAPNHGLDE
jgi:phage/plasmid-associated DNA primase